MPFQSLDDIPFFAIAEALGETSHSRRMAGHLLALYPDMPGAHIITEHCRSVEFVAALGDPANHSVTSILLESGLLPSKKVRALAGLVGELLASGERGRHSENIISALGSPQIEADSLMLLSRFSSSATPEVRNALLANPFIHGNHAFSAPDKADNYAGFALNAARFGNLANPQVVSVLKEVLADDLRSNGVLTTGPVFRALTRRPDLPEDLVQTLGSHPGSDIADHYLELVNNAAHQRLVLSGKITIGKMMKAGTLKQWVFSPALDSSEIEGIYDAGGDNDNTLLASFLYAAKCPERIYREIKPKMHLLGIPNFLRRSPWAKTHIEEIPRAKFFAKLQDELLDWQADDSEKLDCLAIPTIPFNGIHPDDLTETFKKDGELAAALVIGATRDRDFAKRLLHADVSREEGVAIMFIPYASGRQIEKAVAKNPELAALAACHTNGGDIPLDAVPENQRHVVERIRGERSLPGRAAVLSGRGDTSLVL